MTVCFLVSFRDTHASFRADSLGIYSLSLPPVLQDRDLLLR